MITIQGDPVILRDFKEEDWADVHDYAKKPEVVKYMPWGPNDEEGSKDFVRRMVQEAAVPFETRSTFNLAVVLKETGKVVGGCHLAIDSNHQGNIGYCFDSTVWRQGIGTETARLLVRFGFKELGLHRIWATCDPLNIGSRKVLENAGMKFEGIMRSHMMAHGTWRDSCLLAVIEGDAGVWLQ